MLFLVSPDVGSSCVQFRQSEWPRKPMINIWNLVSISYTIQAITLQVLRVALLFLVSVNVGNSWTHVRWVERPRKPMINIWNYDCISYIFRAITTSGLLPVLRATKLFPTWSDVRSIWIEFRWFELPRKPIESVWNYVFISYTIRAITTSGFEAGHAVSGSVPSEYSLFGLSFCQLTLEWHKDRRVTYEIIAISLVVIIKTEFFITTGSRPPYCN
jgi:hypothetical protein